MMMNDEKVIKANGKNYLGDFMDDLPDNVMLNKVTTGSGMTSVVLSNKVKYVLAVPFVSLIINKKDWCKQRGIDVCCVYAQGDDEIDVANFKGDKIMTTYDSLEKVTKALEERGDLSEWKICIDEAHKIVDSAAFRPRAIKSVLNNYSRYKSFVFGTATPIKDEYQLPCLKHIQKVRIDWGELCEVKVNFCKYEKNIDKVVAVLAIDYLSGTRTGNAHIFINSVSSIASIIRTMKKGAFDKPSEIRIVCASGQRNHYLIKKRLGNNYSISSVGSKVRKVNFYTSTAFEGCDIYDEQGKNYIITDGGKDYTKIDIVTLLPQIIGRVRNSKFKDQVDLMYSGNRYISTLTEEEFKFEVKKNIKAYEVVVSTFNSGNGELKTVLLEGATTNSYLIVDGEELLLNDSAWYNEMHNYSTLHNTYYISRDGKSDSISNGVKRINQIDYEYNGISKIEIKGINKLKIGAVSSFADSCENYFDLVKNENYMLLHLINKNESLIHKAYTILGENKMRALKLRKKSISEALILEEKFDSKNNKIVKLLNLKTGLFYPKYVLKKKLQKIYDSVGIPDKAKALDVSKWYGIKDENRREGDKVIAGLVILTCNFRLVD